MEQEEKWSTKANAHNSLPPHYRVLFTPRLKVCVCVSVGATRTQATGDTTKWYLASWKWQFNWYRMTSSAVGFNFTLFFPPFRLPHLRWRSEKMSRHRGTHSTSARWHPAGASWLRCHSAVGDATGDLPLYTSTSHCNHRHQLCFIHVHTLARMEPLHTAVLCSV